MRHIGPASSLRETVSWGEPFSFWRHAQNECGAISFLGQHGSARRTPCALRLRLPHMAFSIWPKTTLLAPAPDTERPPFGLADVAVGLGTLALLYLVARVG